MKKVFTALAKKLIALVLMIALGIVGGIFIYRQVILAGDVIAESVSNMAP